MRLNPELPLLLVIVALATACGRTPPVETFTGPTMGTTYHITVVGFDSARRRLEVQGVIDKVLEEVDAHLSTYTPTSEISAFNRLAATDWQSVSPMLHAVLAAANDISRKTGGAFDVTVGPLVDAWGFGVANNSFATTASFEPPGDDAVQKARGSVGFRLLELRGPPEPAARKDIGALRLDVNGIAPGYAVDRIAVSLAQLGIRDYLVELGGEVRVGGHRPDGRPWQIAVEAPIAGERRAYAGLQLVDLAVSTSGDYRDFRVAPDGHRLSHTIDPRSGRPISHGLASVTVVYPRAMEADAYATALLVLGPEEGYALGVRLGLPALFIERGSVDGAWKERATPAFERLQRPVR